MNQQTISMIAGLLAEALRAGISLKQIMSEVKNTGRVSPETWAQIEADVTAAGDLWEQS